MQHLYGRICVSARNTKSIIKKLLFYDPQVPEIDRGAGMFTLQADAAF